MDQRRLFLFIAISVAILVVSQALLPRHAPPPPAHPAHEPTASTPSEATPPSTLNPAAPGTEPVPVPPPRDVPRVPIEGPRLSGSLSLLGARVDDAVLRDYHETVDKSSPLVRVLEPLGDPQPYTVQFGWAADAGVKVPGNDTLWTSSGGAIAPGHPVTIHWNNGAGLDFAIAFTIDGNYMLGVTQTVRNGGGAPVALRPWSRIRRDYTPVTAGYYILHEGMLGVMNNTLHELTYKNAKADAAKHDGVAYEAADHGGWAGITDKYWLTALIPDQALAVRTTWNHWLEHDADRYQVGFIATDAVAVAPGATATSTSRLFVGAKEVRLLDRYQDQGHIPLFSYAVDFGWFWFLTKPIFYALDWLNAVTGNFGIAILIFTLGVKALFFPLASRSYASMGKMRLLQPKVQALRERYKDDPAKQQQEMMALYRTEKVNPASGCLPMLIQIPVFFSLYKDIFVTIELRHAPFFGWIRDLSAVDPTNVFTLFGLIPWNPVTVSPFLHLGVWPLIMGLTMWAQQRLNPPPPDPTQARVLQFMPLIFTFMLARFPAGLVIYWSWNNTLTILQQWYIQRNAKLSDKTVRRTA